MNEFNELIEEIYEEANIFLNDIYKEEKEAREKLLNKVARIMLTYKIVDSFLKVTAKEKQKIKNDFNKELKNIFNSLIELENKKTTEILTNAAIKVGAFFDEAIISRNDINKIVNSAFKGEIYSERIWSNINEVSKLMQKNMNDFFNSSISVNDIENIIKKHFNTNASNVKRLVNTEVSRVINEINNVQFKELGVKKVIYNAELDKGTCEVCEGLHGTIFKLEDKPVIPQHPNCRCYYEIKE